MPRMPGNFGPGGFMPGPPPPRIPYRDGRYRGPHPLNEDDDPTALAPPPIIKKEELEGFQPVPIEADGWATSASDIDYKSV